jgi:hypothetical protein
MGLRLFKLLSRRRATFVDTEKAIEENEDVHPKCPPCTGRCFQGRACPSSASADPALVALLRRSPQQ